MTHRRRAASYSAALAALLAGVVTLSAGIGPVSLSASTVVKVLLNAVAVPTGVSVYWHGGLPLQVPSVAVRWTSVFSYPVETVATTIVVTIRLPRIALGAVVGCALATAGVVMQGFFRNPMADPSIIGVSSGAAAGAVLAMVAPFALPLGLGIRGAAFVGAVVTAFLVYLIASEGRRTPVATLLLAGVAVQTFLGAVVSYLLLQSGESMRTVLHWLMGNLDGATWGEVGVTAVFVPLLFLLLALFAEDMNVLLMGEEEARALGIEVEWTKRILLAGSSVLTAAAVAVAGVIGFVGLVVPHMVRLVVGPDHRVLLPTSALAGASFLVATDTMARTGTVELPVGIVTAALGAPFFLFLLRRREVQEL